MAAIAANHSNGVLLRSDSRHPVLEALIILDHRSRPFPRPNAGHLVSIAPVPSDDRRGTES